MVRPPHEEKEMMKIFLDTLKNLYFDRMLGLQLQFFTNLIPIGERVEDAVKSKKIVDTSALLALAEQAAKKTTTKKKEGEVKMISRNNRKQKQILPTSTVQPIQNQQRPVQARGLESRTNQPFKKEPRVFQQPSMLIT